MRLLNLVKDGETTEKNLLFLDGNSLEYLDDSNNLRTVYETDTDDRPIHVLEAKNILDKHKNPIMLKTKTDGNLYICVDGAEDKLLISTTADFSDTEKELIDTRYKEFFNKMTAAKEIIFCNSSIKVVDLGEQAIVIDLVKYNSDTYTDTVDLNNIISYSCIPGTTCKIDLNVQYSIGGNIYSKTTTFEGFKYDEKGVLEKYNFIETLGDVDISVINGLIKVDPRHSNVDEFIINNCVITYGKLN